MQKNVFKYSLLFLLLLVLQIVLLNNIRISGYAYPQIYILFILILPVGIAPWLLLVSAFALGLVMDMFSNSLAIHTAASVFMAFCRPGVIKMVAGKVFSDDTYRPGFQSFGGYSLFTYVVFLVLLHHLTLFFLEVFRFTEVLHTLSRALLSASLSVIFIMIGLALLDRPDTRSK